MCVIALVTADDHRLTDDQIGKMFNNNNAGAGVCWFSQLKNAGPDDLISVKWVKGLDEDQVNTLLPTLPVPYAVHFRNPSPNTSTSLNANHPFAINDEVDASLEGEIEGGAVLMHNGFWGQWRDKTLEAAISTRCPIPAGPWTDSRALAYMANALGAGVLTCINEKVLLFSVDTIETYGIGWVKQANGLLVSNTTWLHTTVMHQGSTHAARVAAAVAAGMSESTGGGSRHGSFCGPRLVEGQVVREGEERLAQGGTAAALGFTANPRRADEAVPGGRDLQEAAQQTHAAVSGRPTQPLTPERQGAALTPQDEAVWARRVANGTDCQDCGNGPGYIQNGGVRRCWPCWDKASRKPSVSGTCQTCRTLETTQIVLDTGDWVCDPCWRRQGKPAIVRNQDLTGMQAKALQARRAGGTA